LKNCRIFSLDAMSTELVIRAEKVVEHILTTSHWNNCSPAIRRLHTRNYFEVAGTQGHLSSRLICWTEDWQRPLGGTRTVILLGQYWNIPVRNLSNPEDRKRLEDYLNK
jgi:hypothetical protein